MRTIHGKVEPKEKGLHIAGPNLADVESLIVERTGLPCVQGGTLNIIELAEPYIVQADTEIAAAEYNEIESIKLQRCVIRGVRAVIMRPDSHELTPRGLARLELMSHYHLRTYLDLDDNEDVEVEVDGDQDWWYQAQ